MYGSTQVRWQKNIKAIKEFFLAGSFLRRLILKIVSMRVNRDVNQKKWIILSLLFFMKDCFHLKVFRISYQKEYTGVIVKKETWTFKKNYFIMKYRLSTKLSWRSYQWIWTGARIKSRILKVIKLSDCEWSFVQKIVLKIVSMRDTGRIKKGKFRVFE